MPCVTEDSTTRCVRASNSVIRNQNHILKCTLKTMLDNPQRSRDRALNSIIGLCRKQCNGPCVKVRPRKVKSFATVQPQHYTPICPPPYSPEREREEAEKLAADQAEIAKFLRIRRAKMEKLRKKKAECPTQKVDVSSDPCCSKCCAPMCSTNCCRCCCPCACCPPPCGSPCPTKKSPTRFKMPRGRNPPAIMTMKCKTRKSPERCSRRCCLPPPLNDTASPSAMSPLCCPPPVGATSCFPRKCSPIVRSYRCVPPRCMQMSSPWPPLCMKSPKMPKKSAYPRAYSAPSANICRNNPGENGGDSEVDPPRAFPLARAYMMPSSHLASDEWADPSRQSVAPHTFMNKMRDTSKSKTFTKPTPHPVTSRSSARDDPLSVTTWKTSKPIRFSDFLPRK